MGVRSGPSGPSAGRVVPTGHTTAPSRQGRRGEKWPSVLPTQGLPFYGPAWQAPLPGGASSALSSSGPWREERWVQRAGGWAGQGQGPPQRGGHLGPSLGRWGARWVQQLPGRAPSFPFRFLRARLCTALAPIPGAPRWGSEACCVSPAASPQLHSTAGGGQNAPSQDGSMTFPCPMGQGWGILAAGTRRRAWACQPPRCCTVPEAKVGVPAVTTQREGRGQGRPAWRGGAPTRWSWGLGDSWGGRRQPPKSPSSPLAAECVGPGLHRIAGRTCT